MDGAHSVHRGTQQVSRPFLVVAPGMFKGTFQVWPSGQDTSWGMQMPRPDLEIRTSDGEHCMGNF